MSSIFSLSQQMKCEIASPVLRNKTGGPMSAHFLSYLIGSGHVNRGGIKDLLFFEYSI
jgi:hypothetical protein